MNCPKCKSKHTANLDRWLRQCLACGHQWSVTRHPERPDRTHRQEEHQP